MSSVAYISAAANRFNHVADISADSLVAFGSSKFVALWDAREDDSVVLVTLRQHEGLVTAVRFMADGTFVSGDDKGNIIFWKKSVSKWDGRVSVERHGAAIACICVCRDMVVSGASDGLVKIWKKEEHKPTDILKCIQTLTLKKKLPLALALTPLPGTNSLLLATAGTDGNIDLWLSSEENFTHVGFLAGHEDWIRSLAFRASLEEGNSIFLASGSQDATIRLWKIELWRRNLAHSSSESLLNDDIIDAFEESLADMGDSGEGGKQISLKRHILSVKNQNGEFLQFSVTFDALLVGHEAGVTSLSWRPSLDADVKPTLLSTSTDSSLILWSPSSVASSSPSGTSIWINCQRFGDIGGQRLGGFVGGLWGREGSKVLSWGWTGAWRTWNCAQIVGGMAEELWKETGSISGHNGPIKGLDWSPSGKFLISTGLDQTTRIHTSTSVREGTISWHEIARPQIHGYDLIDVAFIDDLKFVSIADEKVARIFEAPRGFVNLVEALGVAHFSEDEQNRPLGASVPPLGLSNKAMGDDSNRSSAKLDERPFESELASRTLWPESEKIFGHGYESITLGMSNSRRLMATACRATSAEYAVVRIYDTATYRAVGQPLEGHNLAVTRIAFSPDDKLVLTVSKDRSWRLYELDLTGGYVAVASRKTHSRIIWDCAWTLEGDMFATASRDKSVKIWKQVKGEQWDAIMTISTSTPATAVAFSQTDSLHKRRLAVGVESGDILIYAATRDTPTWTLETVLDSRSSHTGHIYRLAWRPKTDGGVELASCSEDGTLRILIVQTTTTTT